MILSMPNDNDLKISNFGRLQARQKRARNKQLTIQWRKYPGASSYTVYGARCGKKIKKLKTVKGNTYTQKKLKKGTYYKYIVVANGGGKALAVSKMIHIATSGGRNGNVTKLKVNKKALNLKAGKSAKLKVKVLKKTGKVRNHRKNLFESSDTAVATVNKQGKVTAIGKGKCVIYCYAQNGIFKKVKVTVK